MNRYDLYGYLIAVVVTILAVAALVAGPIVWDREYNRTPEQARPRWGRFARGMVVAALLFDHAAGPVPVQGGAR